ncbi:MAG: dienelactone hydrolase family protein [Rhodospirillaceae bacterium]|nr:dienelactone hydrolase family protein [Rhodospirillaceae bacterium]
MGETIKLTSDDGFTFSAYQAKPEGKPKGCVVVVQEIFGVNSHIRRDTDKFAKLGYMAVAPAFFDRIETGVDLGYDEAGFAKGRDLVTKLGMDNALRDVRATANYLLTFGPVGVVGYCWGGSIAWASATRLGLVSSGYYGGRTAGLMHERPQAPVILHFGARDKHIPLSDVTKLRYAHQSVPIYVYEADHGFNCEDRKGAYDKPAADLALQRTLDFFTAHLA